MNSHRRQRGFTMIEVLVAMIILAIGLLGVAVSQTVALRQTENANLQTEAMILANELVEHMRLAGDDVTDFAKTLAEDCSDCPAPMQAWYQRLGNALPGGRVRVEVQTQNVQTAGGVAKPSMYSGRITLEWIERGADQGDENQAGETRQMVTQVQVRGG